MAEQVDVLDRAPRVDIDGAHPQSLELTSDSGPKVQPRRARRRGGTTARQCCLHFVGHRGRHFIIAAADRGSQQHRDVRLVCTHRQHGLDGTGHHAVASPDPAGVHGRDNARARIGQQHRNAIGADHRQGQSRCARYQSVRVVERGVARAIDHFYVVAVHLVHPDHPVRAESDGRGQPDPVGRHGSRVIADVVAQVEGVKRRRRDTACPSGADPPDTKAHSPSIRLEQGRLAPTPCRGRHRIARLAPHERRHIDIVVLAADVEGCAVGRHRHAHRVGRLEQAGADLAVLA